MEAYSNLLISVAFFGGVYYLLNYLKKNSGNTVPSATPQDHGSVKVMSSDVEFQNVIKTSKPVLVDFTASWCGPCKRIAPYFAQLSQEYPSITFVKVDVDQLRNTAQTYGVRAMPTFIVLKNGSKVEEMTGASPDGLKRLAEKYK